MDVAEMVVRAVPEGVGDVEGELDGMTESVEEAGEEMDDTADGFADLQRRFQGAGAALAGAVAMTTGVLLGRIPILSETMSAFGAVFDSMGLRVDGLIRGPLSRFNDFLFDLSDTFHEADGALGAVVDTISVLVPVVMGAVAGYASWAIAQAGVIAGLLKTGGAILTVLKAIGKIAKGIAMLVGWKFVLIAALSLLAWHFREGIVNAVHTAVDHLGNLAEWFTDAVSDAVDWGADLIGGWIDGITSVGLQNAVDFVTGLADTFTDLVSDAWGWGRNVMVMFIAGVRSMVGALGELLEDIPFIGRVLELFDVVIDALRGNDVDIAGDLGAEDIGGSISGVVSNVRDSGSDFIGSVGGAGGTINLDGRSIENTQGRYRADNLHRRGG